MRQALHILRKDVRYFYREIILIWILAVAVVWSGRWAEGLFIASAAFLIGRLVHAETIPGNRQFWITRPYCWKSLLGAKILFIVIFVNLPAALAQMGILKVEGFSLAMRLPALLWSQGLLALCVWFPVAALAAMTSSTLTFIFSCLGLLVVGFAGGQGLFLRYTAVWPTGLEWIRISFVAAVLAGLAFVIFYLQYKDRRTALSRAVAIAVAVAGLVAYRSLPWPAALRLQSWLGRAQADAAPIRLSFKPGAPVYFQTFGNGSLTSLHVPLAVSGIPTGDDVRLDVADVAIQVPAGQSWTGRAFTMLGSTEKNGSTEFDTVFPINAVFSRAIAGRPATVRVSANLTLFGHSRRTTTRVADKPVNVSDNMQCYRDRFSVLFCRTPFRWPGALVYAQITGTVLSPLNTLISYAPYPAGLSLDPIEEHWAAGPPLSQPDVTVIWKEPIAYFKRDVELSGVPLGQYRYVTVPGRN